MSRIVYVNGEYVPEEQAKVSVFDRGFLFADGVYEVSAVLDGRLVDNAAHLARLERSLAELKLTPPVPLSEIPTIQQEVVTRNGVGQGLVYLQITRGAADRDFAFPTDAVPSLVMFSQTRNLLEDPVAARGISVVTMPDLRWARRDIKTVQLVAASMAKQAARDAGADDAWLVEDGVITEATSSNAYIVTADGTIVTRALSHAILHGITRRAVLRLASENGLDVEELGFSVKEAQAAREAFVTSATGLVMPVVRIDGQEIGDGTPGPIAKRLRELYLEMARAEA
ncbi:MAG: D-amino-acid transaminase [Chloroflexi bacterium]|nr:D-amino-acid transaminase [Chloroflexota bacterium]MDA1145417.1 D-amino-acid transaminase [Chloroflexota bacterium]